MKNENVRFVRIRGRIVPMKSKQPISDATKVKLTANAGASAGIAVGTIHNLFQSIKDIKNNAYIDSYAGMSPKNVMIHSFRKQGARIGKAGLIGAGIGAGIGLLLKQKPISNKAKKQAESSIPSNLILAGGLALLNPSLTMRITKSASPYKAFGGDHLSKIKKLFKRSKISGTQSNVIYGKFPGKKE